MVCKQEIGKVRKNEKEKFLKRKRNEKVRRKNWQYKRDRQVKTFFKKFFLSQYFFLVEEKSGCLLCSISILDAPFQSLVLRFLSAVLWLYLLMCPLRDLDCPGVTWLGASALGQLLERDGGGAVQVCEGSCC
jgi:hypothetical protein